MKKIISVLLTLVLTLGCVICVAAEDTELDTHDLEPLSTESVDITAAFTDRNFRTEVYKAIGKKAPAPIYDTDVVNITQLNVSSKKIKSLAGLEYFTGLKILGCGWNDLTSLPSLPASLERLSCSANKLTSLPPLPPGLNTLFCSTNQLTSIDVTDLPIENHSRFQFRYNNIRSVSDIKGFNVGSVYPQNYDMLKIWGVTTLFRKKDFSTWFLLIALGGWAWMWIYSTDILY